MASRSIVLIGIALLTGCEAPTEVAVTQPFDEFTEIAERIRDSDFQYQGMARLRELEAARASEPLSRPEKLQLEMVLSREKLFRGRTSEAVDHIDTALRMVETEMGFGAPLDWMLESVLKDRALDYMRLAEDTNCVARHNAESCIYPLAGDGVHTVKRHAEQARTTFLRYLEMQPDDMTARWLLNIVAMTLGEHPDGVPEHLRIDPMSAPAGTEVARFTNLAALVGIDGADLAGAAIVEDFDNDGALDIVTTTSDSFGTAKYLRRSGAGYENATVGSGLDQQLGGLNAIAGDYDNDGDMDVFILRGGWMEAHGHIRNSLMRNDAGTFVDVTRDAGVAHAYPTQAAVWLDYDNDGDLDLYVVNETMKGVPADRAYEGSDFSSQLYRNSGDGTFEDVAVAAGVPNDRYGKGVTAGDYDNDGDMDIYVSNLGANRLYRNLGDGSFEDVAPALDLTGPEMSFAPWFFDYDNDGWLDLFVGAYDARVDDVARDHLGMAHSATPPALYRNNGDGTFSDVAEEAGLAHAYMPMGANFGDIDNDGYLDIYLGTGRPGLENLVPNVMLRNVRGVSFENVTTPAGLGHLQKGHGIAFNDLDHDGDQDIFHQLGGFFPVDRYANALFANPGADGRFLKLQLQGTVGNRLGVGARIEVAVETAEGIRQIYRSAGSVSSFGGSSLARHEIGLGNALRIQSVSVVWPSGARSVHGDVPLDSFIRIVEGADAYTRLDHVAMPFSEEG